MNGAEWIKEKQLMWSKRNMTKMDSKYSYYTEELKSNLFNGVMSN